MMYQYSVTALSATSVILLLVCFFGSIASSKACNEAVCASVVSKCLLLKSCECNMTDKRNCSCCRDCHKCLGRLYTQCCACVGLCSEKQHSDMFERTSTIEELSDPIPELFDVLTEEKDAQERWTSFTYPAHLDLLQPGVTPPSINQSTVDTGAYVGQTRNCTVAFMSECLSLGRCRESCMSMGAARYRWFHQYACCECVGHTCWDYGRGEPLCLRCPPVTDDENEADDEYHYDVHETEKYRDTSTTKLDTETAVFDGDVTDGRQTVGDSSRGDG